MRRSFIAVALSTLSATLCLPALAEPGVARGEYLVRGPAGCGNCHTANGPNGKVAGMQLAGGLVEDSAEMTAYAPNLTPAGDIANWSDAELEKAIREGIRPDGSLIGPPMPFSVYRGWGDEDLASIVMFLRTLPPIDNQVPVSTYRIPLPPAYGPPVASVTPPPRGVTVAYGEYLANAVTHCMDCHTPLGPQGRMMDRVGDGGFQFHGPWGTSVAANIRNGPDGIGKYTDTELKTMITDGVRPDGSPMLPPMPYPYLAQFTPEDLDALVLYLRSLPPLPKG